MRGEAVSTLHDALNGLRRVAAFAGIPPGALESLASGTRVRPFGRGDVLLHPSRPAECIHVIDRGLVRIGQTTADGRHFGFGVVGPGAVIGVLGVFGSAPDGEEARSLSEGVAVEVSRRAVCAECERSPPAALAFGRLAAEEARRARQALVESTAVDVPTRVARQLIQLATALGVRADPTGPVVVPVLHRELADLTGTARETVTKVLSSFVAAGWVATSTRRVIIRDERSLETFAGLDEPGRGRERGLPRA